MTFNNPSNSFIGNGTGLTNVNAITLNDVDTNGFWQTGGNSGVSPAGGKFLGTSDSQALEFRVNNQRALLLQPGGSAPHFIAGTTNNNQSGGNGHAIGGGNFNSISANQFATIPGGYSNSAAGDYSFAAGQRAKALHSGAFVWADSQAADFSSTTNNQLNLRAGGGVRIVTTNAANTNGVGMTLDGVPVLVGSGVGVLAWQLVTSTTKQMESHYGYILTNSQPVTLTLPLSASLNIGDVIRVAGGGSGGWKVVQNAGQSILAGNFTVISSTTTNWTATSASALNWRAIASSADGSKLVAVVYGGGIYTSSDAGANWTLASGTSPRSWTAIASSADGVKLVAVASGGGIFTSVNSGVTWSAAVAGSTGLDWQAVASSADGTRLIAGILTGTVSTAFVYLSTNSGASWTQTSPSSGTWQALASSADGSVLLAGQKNGYLFFSVDSGGSWATVNSVGNTLNCTAVAVSADGGKLVAVANLGSVYTSADAGNNWVTTGAPATNWSSVASSADGSKLVAGITNGAIYVSGNSGVTWQISKPGAAGWSAIASSIDGGRLTAAAYGGGIYSLSAAQRTTTTGTAGYLSGEQNSAVELQYAGNNRFIPISHEGAVFVY